MAGDKNTQVLFASRPQGAPTAANFRIVETPIPEPGPGEMLLRTVYLGLDPVIRLRMNEGSYWPAFEIGKPLGARTVCVVVKTNNTGFVPGDLLVMQGIWADYMISDGKAAISAAIPKPPICRSSIRRAVRSRRRCIFSASPASPPMSA
jgi:NADPH-dependent curcumin reductase